MKLTKEQNDLIEWLGKEDNNAFGECHGQTLDELVMLGLAVIWPNHDPANGYAVVTLHHKWLQRLQEDK